MLVAEELLTPLAGDAPSGPNLRYDPVYDRIKQARREAPFEDPPLKPDWGQVAKLATEVLAGESKDLWIAAWLSEALLRRDGIPGLASGLGVVRGLLENFWEDIHPQPEEGDLEMRAAPLTWIGSYLDVPVRLAPLNREGHTYLDYRESQAVPSEKEAKADKEKRKRREGAVAEGKLDPESFEAGFAETRRDWYEALVASIEASLEHATSLEAFCDERFGDDAPGFRKLRDALAEVRPTARALLDRKPAAEPPAHEPTTDVPSSPGPHPTGTAGEPTGATASNSPAPPAADAEDPAGSADAPAPDVSASSAASLAVADPVLESADQILNRLGTSEPRRAVGILMRDAERQTSERSRFLRRLDAARVMVENGHERVALPILRRMLEQVEQHRLEEWEASQTVAGALGLLYRCLDRLGQDSKERDELYLRVCRLDPLQAMAVRPEDGAAAADGEA